MSRAGAVTPRPPPRSRYLATFRLALVALVGAGCARGDDDAQASRRRCLALVDSLPRLEAEQRAWPRSDSLACEERGVARASELAALRADLEASCGEARGVARASDLAPLLEAADEVRACAACAPEHARHCPRARELFVQMETALGKKKLALLYALLDEVIELEQAA